MKRPIKCFICVLVGLASQVQLAIGQDDKSPDGELEIASVQGTLEAISTDTIKVKTDKGEEYFAVLRPKATFKYSGTAELSFLVPGLFVRFTAPFNPQTRAPQGAIADIEVFREIRQSGKRMSRELLQSQTPGIYPVTENEKEKTQDREKEKRGGKENEAGKDTAVPGGAQSFRVVGRLTAIQGGQMQVFVGNFPIIVQLDPAATVSVSAGDATFCQFGDEVEITGLRKADDKSNRIQADEIEVTGAKPLGQIENGAAASPKSPRGKLGEKDASTKNSTTKSSAPKTPAKN